MYEHGHELPNRRAERSSLGRVWLKQLAVFRWRLCTAIGVVREVDEDLTDVGRRADAREGGDQAGVEEREVDQETVTSTFER